MSFNHLKGLSDARNFSSQQIQFIFVDVFLLGTEVKNGRAKAAYLDEREGEGERQNRCTFGFLGVRLRLRLPDELAQLIHLSKRHPPEQADRKDADRHTSTLPSVCSRPETLICTPSKNTKASAGTK